MNPFLFKIYAAKLTVFGAILLYLAVDLLVWHGPLWRTAYGNAAAKNVRTDVASVYGEAITPAQLARHTAEQDKLAGRTKAEKSRRASRLLELVRAAELRTRTRYNDLNLPPCREQAEQEVARLATRAKSDEEFDAQLASQGYTRQSFTDKMEARMREQAQLERAIAELCKVTDEDIAKHYEQIPDDQLTIPPSRHVRHIFFATLHKNPDEVKAVAELVMHRLKGGEDFAALAAEASEDERSAPNGGDLGDIYDDPTNPLPKIPLFGRRNLPVDTPVLVQSEWGWHILMAGEVKPAHKATLEECKESLRTALISAQRELAAQAYYKSALKDGRQHKRIQIYVP